MELLTRDNFGVTDRSPLRAGVAGPRSYWQQVDAARLVVERAQEVPGVAVEVLGRQLRVGCPHDDQRAPRGAAPLDDDVVRVAVDDVQLHIRGLEVRLVQQG